MRDTCLKNPLHDMAIHLNCWTAWHICKHNEASKSDEILVLALSDKTFLSCSTVIACAVLVSDALRPTLPPTECIIHY